MKKSIFLSLLMLLPSFSLIAQETIAVPKTPASVKKINSFENAKKFLSQSIDCLILGNVTSPDAPHSCNKSVQLGISYALGFLLASQFPIKVIAEILKKKGSNIIARNAAQALFETLVTAGLFGASMVATQYNVKIAGENPMMVGGPLVHPLLSSIYQIIISASFIKDDIQEISLSTPTQFLKTLSRYLTMNAKCVLSESHCEGLHEGSDLFGPHILTHFARRKALYFWLGYLSGTIFNKIPFKKI